jgi:hypothetical protein
MIFDRAELTLYNLIRSVSNDREWIDAYNTQINRMLNRTTIEELSSRETRILYMLVTNCTSSYLNYILKKHC